MWKTATIYHFYKKEFQNSLQNWSDHRLLICAAGHDSSLLFFCLLCDWPTISEPWKGIQSAQNRLVRPCFHPAAVLLLRWLAQGIQHIRVLKWIINKKKSCFDFVMKVQFHLHSVGWGADYQSIWWRWWRLWNQPADWSKHTGCPLKDSLQNNYSIHKCFVSSFNFGFPLLKVSMLAVDDMYQNLAPIVKDKHWAQRYFSIPYTLSTAAETLKPVFKGSTFDMR